MPEPSTCFNATSTLEEVFFFKKMFVQAYDDCMCSEDEQNRDRAHATKKDLEKKIYALQEAVFSAKMEYAIEVLGRENVHGPEDVALLLGFIPKDIPPIPYSRADLEKTKEIKAKGGVEEMLVLFVNNRVETH